MNKSYSDSTGKKLYQKVGNLFFAIAMADDTVHSKEIDKLKSLVREKWLPLDDIEDAYGSDAAYQIEIVFDWLLANEKTSGECFKNFTEFYNEHKAIFSEKIKKLIRETANAIAYSFSGKNKSELILLGTLQLLFQKDKTE
ncbi:hypothetical protein JQC67_10530 [Aurantibacter crassamenti]|uniref:hypothetical protein n=1 Tax=Aurantibacter crassamenti TaxID=1837375 RepID=UPI001939AFF3|nr:hypothetical protein [Aurantibacter crassamenti]MBM1106574.1 hypothetical protein [Aurantibacter crassamenti]